MLCRISLLLLFLCFSASLSAAETIAVPEGYSLEATLTDSHLLPGERTVLTVKFKYKDLEDYEIVEPEFTDIVVTELDSKDYKDEEGYFVEELHYSVSPKKEGTFLLKNIKVDTEIIDATYTNFNNRSKYTKRFTVTAKPLTLQVNKLPNNISAIGDYKLKIEVDKTHLKSGELLTLTISLHGEGNIKNLDAIEPKITNATTYLLYTTKSNRQRLQTKTYSIISQKPYIIPSFVLDYFDKNAGVVKRTQTDLIQIKIDGYTEENKKTMPYSTYLIILLDVLFILLFTAIYIYLKRRDKHSKPDLIKRLKGCSNKDIFYKKVVVFLGRDKELNTLIYSLEDEHLPNFKAVKRAIIKRLVKLRLHERNNLFFTA